MLRDDPRLAMMLTFAIHSTIMGGLFSRIAEVQRTLALEAASFGLTMTGMAVGVLIGLPISAALGDRLGNRRLNLEMFGLSALIVARFRESPPQPTTGASVARMAWPDLAKLRLLAFAASGLVGEMVLRNWSVIYLRDLFGTADWLAALTRPLFVLTQTVGRFALAGTAARFGGAAVARTLTVTTLTGIALMALAGNITLAMVGCGLIGLGTAASYPLSFSALARMTSRSSGENMAGFSILQNLMWLVTPPLFGFVAQGVDMRVALALMLPLPIVAWFNVRQVSTGQMT